MGSKFEGLYANAHDYFCQIWLSVTQKTLDNLDGESKILGRLMLEHPEYQHLWTKPYSYAEIDLERLMRQGEASPHIHLAIEATVLNQVEAKNPPEAARAYKALQTAGVEKSEARHVLGRVLAGVAWEISHKDMEIGPGYENLYLRRLKRVAKNPLSVVREQTEQLANRLL